MAESAKTAEMYRGGLDHTEDSMPQSLSETYNATHSQDTPELSDPEDISYEMETVSQAFDAYSEMENGYGDDLLEEEDAIEAFGELFEKE